MPYAIHKGKSSAEVLPYEPDSEQSAKDVKRRRKKQERKKKKKGKNIYTKMKSQKR